MGEKGNKASRLFLSLMPAVLICVGMIRGAIAEAVHSHTSGPHHSHATTGAAAVAGGVHSLVAPQQMVDRRGRSAPVPKALVPYRTRGRRRASPPLRELGLLLG